MAMVRDSAEKLSPLSVALHWTVGVFVIVMLALGLIMESFEIFFLYAVHKSIGIVLFAVIIWRVWWRAVNGWPPPLGEYSRWQRAVARAAHWVLIIGTLLMPLSGVAMTVFGGRGLAVFGIPLLAANLDAAGETIAYSEWSAHFAHTLHALGGKALIAIITLHTGAALWHHFIQRDNVLRRMLACRSTRNRTC